MEQNIVDYITDDLTIDELGEIARTSLAAIYSKLRSDYAFGCNTRCMVTELGAKEYAVELIFVDDDRYDKLNSIQVYQI